MEEIIDQFIKSHSYCQFLYEKGDSFRKFEISKEDGYGWDYLTVLFQRQLAGYLERTGPLFLNGECWQKVLIVNTDRIETQLYSVAIHIINLNNDQYIEELKSNEYRRYILK